VSGTGGYFAAGRDRFESVSVLGRERKIPFTLFNRECMIDFHTAEAGYISLSIIERVFEVPAVQE